MAPLSGVVMFGLGRFASSSPTPSTTSRRQTGLWRSSARIPVGSPMTARRRVGYRDPKEPLMAGRDHADRFGYGRQRYRMAPQLSAFVPTPGVVFDLLR